MIHFNQKLNLNFLWMKSTIYIQPYSILQARPLNIFCRHYIQLWIKDMFMTKIYTIFSAIQAGRKIFFAHEKFEIKLPKVEYTEIIFFVWAYL